VIREQHSGDPLQHFHVFKRGALTVVGFEMKHLAQGQDSQACHDQLSLLLQTENCRNLVVDLSKVDMMSSWILGVLVALRNRGVDVFVYRPSVEMRQELRLTHIDQLIRVRGE
jgi:anti-anti-sigma factor